MVPGNAELMVNRYFIGSFFRPRTMMELLDGLNGRVALSRKLKTVLADTICQQFCAPRLII
jgi:hypothetical protein